VCKAAGRAADELTRRDVVQALLAIPASDALAQLPTLRRDLVAAGNSMSGAFWESTESVLSRMEAGRATVGDVRGWLESTGTEPIQVIPTELFSWPDADEIGPDAAEMHSMLVAHLEELVAAQRIDPDRLLSGDTAALAAYQQAQVDWLWSPLPDGRVPVHEVQDEEVLGFLAEWEDEDADARRILGELLESVGPRPCPEAELRVICSTLRDELSSHGHWYRLLRAAGDVDPVALPEDDRELWLTLASGVVVQRDGPPSDVLDIESEAALAALQHPDWIAAVALLVRGGPGTPVDVDALSHDVAAFDFRGGR
jgi:hypothetical protein